MSKVLFDVIIIGGGLSGLSSSIILARAGWKVLLIEKKSYPYHKVCGEYISKEAIPYLEYLGLDLTSLNHSSIAQLHMSSPNGIQIKKKLELGGIGISRYRLDTSLYTLAQKHGVQFRLETKVTEVAFSDNEFTVSTGDQETLNAKFVIGSYGKRESLDKKFNRAFIKKRTGFMGVKYHIKGDFSKDEIGLHIFKDGYCGIVKIEDSSYCLCYLSKRENMQGFKNIKEMEQGVLFKNPELKQIFNKAAFIYEKPEVINEISFDKKDLIVDHVLMCGDSAGLIAPLCGNGMSMALQASYELCNILKRNNIRINDAPSLLVRKRIEDEYLTIWTRLFSRRLFAGRVIQKAFGNPLLTELILFILNGSPRLTNWIIKQTHGKVPVLPV